MSDTIDSSGTPESPVLIPTVESPTPSVTPPVDDSVTDVTVTEVPVFDVPKFPEPSKDGAYNPAKNPMRRPTWRWDRIAYLNTKSACGAKRNIASYDDKLVADGRKYLSHYQHIASSITADRSSMDLDSAFAEAYVHWPELSQAHRIYVNRGFARWAIEALVLSKEPAERIAADLGCPEGVVTAYEAYFYDVRSRRDSELYIMDALMSPALKNGTSGGVDYDFFWKGLAYWYGTDVLKATWSMGSIPDEMRVQMNNCMRSMMDRNTMRATMARPANSFNAHEIIEEHLAAKQIENNKPRQNDDNSQTQIDGAKQLSNALKLSIASGLVIPSSGIEPRTASSIRDMADAVLNIAVVDPVVRAVAPERSAFDRPVGPVVNQPRLDDAPIPKDMAVPINSILQKIRAKKPA